MTPDARELLAALEIELRRRLRDEGYEFTSTATSNSFVTLTIATGSSSYGDRDPQPAWADDFDDALARRPVIRDQGPPPVRRQPAPRPMRPPPRRLSWLVEGRGR